MTTDIIEGEAVEVERALVVQQPGQALVSEAGPTGPGAMIGMATTLATALRDIVERQNLYTVISGKKYPQVEAWMTIGRMDNVVAREVAGGIFRREDGSYEATVELIRLSDGMVIGRGSAICGTPGDRPWDGRGEPARRSMAVTRATSRAFRQQYSWIMALAGYEPTPADEMPDRRGSDFAGSDYGHDDGGLIGKAITKGTADAELRQTPEGWVLPFRVAEGNKSFIVIAENDLAEVLATIKATWLDQRVKVWGHWKPETIPAKGGKPKITYETLRLERIETPDGILPAPIEDTSELDPDIAAAADLAFPEAETAPLGLVS